MEHFSFLEILIWRVRRAVETAYIKSHNFSSLMVEVAFFSAQYIVNLLSGSHLTMNLWLLLSNGCDNCDSISAFNNMIRYKNNDSVINLNNLCGSSGLFKSGSDNELNSFSFRKLLDWDPFNVKKNVEPKNLTAGNFVQDLCELLETIDVKDKNL